VDNILEKWKKGLTRSSKAAFGQIATLLGATEITDDTWDELEALLIKADIGVDTTVDVLDSLETRINRYGVIKTDELQLGLKEELKSRLNDPVKVEFLQYPAIILIVGVNGSGKTTTIAKLAHNFQQANKKVLLGAADTYRAAAVDQLEIWADRLNIPIISGQPGGDAGAVVYDTVQSAISRRFDIVLIDTAGRLHTRYNLMEELKSAPHAVWLVMDATTGQNAIHQARAFKEAVNVTGVILAKLDSSARGGMAFAIQKELGLPILFAGLGEKPVDLEPFNPEAFVEGILAFEQ
jgi:fused signal recognition particle receptor